MSAKNTPGTWRIAAGGTRFVTVEANGVLIAKVSKMELACLIAAAPDLLAALVWREQFEPREGEDVNARFERVAEAFHRDTGYLRPGKDCRLNSLEDQQAAWDAWMEAGRSQARAAVAKATGSTS